MTIFKKWVLMVGLLACLPLHAEENNFFGKDEIAPGEAALMGIFYDLKQGQDHKPIAMDMGAYNKVFTDFIQSGWDEKVLSRFYRTTKPLYTTQIFVPLLSADEGPKAFDVVKTVKPPYWLVHYRAQVCPPKDGTYRFWGYGDAMFAAAVNGKLYLISNTNTSLEDIWKSPEPMTIPAGNGFLRAGEWLTLKANEPIDLELFFGDRMGGVFCDFFMVEEKGAIFEMDGKYPILPIFQLAPFDTPVRDKRVQPKFQKNATPWKALQ